MLAVPFSGDGMLHFDDPVADLAYRRINLDGLTLMPMHQSHSDRRFVGDASLEAVRLGCAHDIDVHVVFRSDLADRNTAADVDRSVIRMLFHYFRVFQNLFNFNDTCFDISLLVQGRIIFRILAQVSLCPCFLNLFRNLFSCIDLQIFQFTLKFFVS